MNVFELEYILRSKSAICFFLKNGFLVSYLDKSKILIENKVYKTSNKMISNVRILFNSFERSIARATSE